MGAIEILGLNVGSAFEPDFTIDRPDGLGEYVFSCFTAPVYLSAAGGMVTGEPGDCILYAPLIPQWIRGRHGGLANDWMHLRGPIVDFLVQQYQVPLNTVFRPRELHFIPELLTRIKREQQLREPYWEQALELLVEEFFLTLSRHSLAPGTGDISNGELRHLKGFRQIRARIHENFQHAWTVGEMADLASLSPTRFAMLYKRLFGVSPLEDLIQTRLEHARILLANAHASVGETAIQTGFSSIYYFSRLFRRRIGCAPSDYYRVAVLSARCGDSAGAPETCDQ